MEGIPRTLGYRFPAEWEPHAATWLSWPHNKNSWPGKLSSIYPAYTRFVKTIAEGELVNINVNDELMRKEATETLEKAGVNMSAVKFYIHPTNDAWCRDHGPAFLVNLQARQKKVIVNWNYNAWGEKYPPFHLDDAIPVKIAEAYDIPVFNPGIVMEGGAVDFNGEGTVITTTSCLLNENRNPNLTQGQIEQYLYGFYGVEQVVWLGDGIEGDDTDGHIDDITRFVNEDTVITVVEEYKASNNYKPLQENLQTLNWVRLTNGKQLNVIELPMPAPVIHETQVLPASYANFYIANHAVIVPTYRDDKNDQKAMDALATCFPDRKVVGIDSTDLVWGLGSFHCLSQQEPRI